jgi:pimeloyl-ACP methyl ester carboxylesterase
VPPGCARSAAASHAYAGRETRIAYQPGEFDPCAHLCWHRIGGQFGGQLPLSRRDPSTRTARVDAVDPSAPSPAPRAAPAADALDDRLAEPVQQGRASTASASRLRSR